MKTTLRTILISILVVCASALSAQQVNTLYFLENSPMRHTVNPALQPVSKFYLTLPVIGYTSMWVGTNNWTLSDFVFNGPNGTPITPLHPDAPADWLDKHPVKFAFDAEIYTNLLGFGFRIKENGYLHLNISERINVGANVSKSIFGLNDLSSGDIGPLSLGVNARAFSEFALGYSHNINRRWSVGGKIKVLVGQANVGLYTDNIKLHTSLDTLHLTATGDLQVAAPLKWSKLPTDPALLGEFDYSSLIGSFDTPENTKQSIKELLKPSGMGVLFDLGFTYKPIKQLQISAAVTDLGFIRWHRYASTHVEIDTTFTGMDFNYRDYADDFQINTDSIMSTVNSNLEGYKDAIHMSDIEKEYPYLEMLTANLNIGVDANFWDNRVGVGIHSRTRFYHRSHVTEELTLGATFRPVNWFNLAASYSFINGRWSNIGAAISLAPYDGLMFTFATDYIPTSYANAVVDDMKLKLPYKTPGVNLSFGVAIVAGTNKKNKDSDKDGVWDKLDVCPNTPINVRVDEMGCPLDFDGDGVPEYLDECPHTPSESYGLIDSVGCPIDSDYDGVPDYRDACLDTPEEALGNVDVYGCPLDSDGDGVPDYLDQCANTPVAAYGQVDSVGCPLDTDGDEVPDYLDLCPETPAQAHGLVDQYGCPIDTDKDGVYDYLDQCPNTLPEGRNYVDSVGCLLDTDKDGIYDYEDLCPTIAGVKENLGCPEVKREVRNLLNKAMSGIQFENGKATIKPSSYKILNDIAKIFIENPTYIVEVQGHTDNVGKHDYNMDLSQRRAQSVRTYLINQGVPAERLTANGYGPDKPIDTNNTKAGRAKNRRVEFNITFEEVTYETIYDRVQNTENQ